MPEPYSNDLRKRVLLACEHKEGSRADIARRFRVGESTVSAWLRVARKEGRRQAKPHAGGPSPQLDAEKLQRLREIVLENNDGTLADYGEQLAASTGCRVGMASLCRALQKLSSFAEAQTDSKKKTLRASELERDEIARERQDYQANIKEKEASRLVFRDETGITTQMTRTHARAQRGQRACGSVPCGHWRRVTLLGALSVDGILAAMTIEAATSAAVFLAYVQQILIPALLRLKPDAVIVNQDLSAVDWGSIAGAPPRGSRGCSRPHHVE